ncbi:MAG: pentapeptide repeat-containing protein [Actinomycetota bacterium]|nr:pentapeptide repeat-containing protein [Actinomycetota bacterium]
MVLRDAQLDGATLQETTLHGADLRGAGLDRVDLTAASLRGTKLDLAGAVMLAEQHGAEVDGL